MQPKEPPQENPAPAQSASHGSAKRHNSPGLMAAVVILLVIAAILSVVAVTYKRKSVTSNKTTHSVIAPAAVSITDKGFVPATIQVVSGTTVTWTNNDTASHWVATDPYPTDNDLPGFDSNQAFKTNDTYSYTFQTSGTYTYHDQLNPYSFKGTVIVQKTGSL